MRSDYQPSSNSSIAGHSPVLAMPASAPVHISAGQITPDPIDVWTDVGRGSPMLAYRLLMAALLFSALVPASAGGRLAAEQVGAPTWIVLAMSVLVPIGALVIGWTLAQRYGGRS